MFLGSPEWKEALRNRYQQHAEDAARAGREAKPREQFEIECSWQQFVNLARVSLDLPDFARSDWATSGQPWEENSRPGFGSKNLARSLLDSMVMVQAILKAMPGAMRHHVKAYLREGRRSDYIPQAKTFVYAWLSGTPVATNQ